MSTVTNPERLVTNPNYAAVRVGDTVTCRYSGRKMKVARKDKTGAIWERIEAGHPVLNSLDEVKFRYAGTNYTEFEPMSINEGRFFEVTGMTFDEYVTAQKALNEPPAPALASLATAQQVLTTLVEVLNTPRITIGAEKVNLISEARFQAALTVVGTASK